MTWTRWLLLANQLKGIVGELCEKLLANTVIEDYEIVSLAP